MGNSPLVQALKSLENDSEEWKITLGSETWKTKIKGLFSFIFLTNTKQGCTGNAIIWDRGWRKQREDPDLLTKQLHALFLGMIPLLFAFFFFFFTSDTQIKCITFNPSNPFATYPNTLGILWKMIWSVLCNPPLERTVISKCFLLF